MPVVKPHKSAVPLRTAVVLEMGDVEAHAQAILADAHDRAEALLSEAERRARTMTAAADQTGYETGFARGFSQGQEEGRRSGHDEALRQAAGEAAAFAQRWADALIEWDATRERMHDEAREDVLRFAFALAERITLRSLRVDPTIVQDQLFNALRHVARPTSLQITIHPADRSLAQAIMPKVTEIIGRSADIRMVDDPHLERGGCVLSTQGGYVDASIGSQLDRMAEALLRDGRLIGRVATGPAGVNPPETSA